MSLWPSVSKFGASILWRAGVAGILAIGACFGQTSFSTVRGNVTDPSGAVMQGVNLTLSEISTNIVRRSQSLDSGSYEFIDVKPGTYRLRAQAPGFRAFVADNLILDSSQIRRVDIAMQVGEAATEITVNAAAAVIETEDPKVSASFSAQIYRDIPAMGNDRFNPTAVLATMPGIQPPESGFSVAIAGVNSQVQEGMDGATTEGAVNQIHNMENVAEVKVVISNNSAEFARAGYFDLVGERGVNALHGKVYYYHLNSALNARGFFEPKKAPTRFHTFGASASGPIFKNRTFYYAGYNAQRDPSKTWLLASAPTQAMRRGDFSELLSIASRITVKDPLNSQPFPNNVIPTSRLNSVPLKVQDTYIPEPNQGAPGSFSNNLAYLHPYPTDLYRVDYFEGRIDHKISERNDFFGRLSQRWTPYVLGGSWPNMAWTRRRYAWQMVFSDTHIFSPNLVNTLRFGWYKNNSDDGETINGYTPPHGDEIVKQLGLQGVNPDGLSAMGFPRMDITGYTTLRVNPGGIVQHDNYRQYAESLSWVKGRHTMKFGGEFKTFARLSATVPEGTYGYYSFTGTLTGYGYADFLLGLPQTSRRLRPITSQEPRSWELGLYFTDSWKVNRRLTLNYGLRWDYFSAPTFANGLQYNFNRETGTVVVPDEKALQAISPLFPTNQVPVAVGDTIARTSRRNFVPRLGAAYLLDKKTAVHGGYGIYNEFLGEFKYGYTGGPYQLLETFTNRITNGQPLFSFPNPYPGGSGTVGAQSVTGYPVDMKNGKVHQFNLTVERQVGQVGLSAAYIGSRSYGLNYNVSINQQPLAVDPATGSRPPKPYPNLSGVTWAMNDGKQRFNSLVLRARARVRSLTFDTHWTWAHNMADNLNLDNAYDHYFWNRVGFTPQQRAVSNFTWELPMGRGKRYLASAPKIVRGVVGGWQLYWVAIFQTGMYFSPTYSGVNPADGLAYSGSPDRLSNGNLAPDQRKVEHWFDTAAFTAPPRDRFGNSGKNIIEAPGRHVHNLSLSKYFPIYERFKVQLMFAATNILNRPNFATPSNNVIGPTGGVVGAIVDVWNMDKGYSRRMEGRIRVTW
jgi:hypothetical protein